MKKKHRFLTIPNILSFFRIMLVPLIVWTLFVPYYFVSAGLLLLSGLTDVVDGYIARHYNMVSAFGKALDPIADKLTVLAVIVSLCFFVKGMIVLVVIFVIKEFIMGVEGLIIIKKTGTTYSACWYGKLTTCLLYLTMLLHIVWVDIPNAVSITLICVCSAAVLLSLILYTIRNVRAIRAAKKDVS